MMKNWVQVSRMNDLPSAPLKASTLYKWAHLKRHSIKGNLKKSAQKETKHEFYWNKAKPTDEHPTLMTRETRATEYDRTVTEIWSFLSASTGN